MLTHLLVEGYDSNPKVFNSMIPGVTLRRARLVRTRRDTSLCSTHSLYRPSIKKAIYVVRDPRNAISSYYRFTTTRNNKDVPVAYWVKAYLDGLYGPRWDQHVESWLGMGRQQLRGGDNFLVVKYEDMKQNPQAELARVARFMNIAITDSRLDRAVEMSSPKIMREWETKEKGEVTDRNASFYRGGQAKEWGILFTNKQRDAILDKSRYSMEMAGYQD